MSRPFNKPSPRTCHLQRPQRKLVTGPSHPLHTQAQPRAPLTASDHPHQPVPPPLAPRPSVAPRDCQIKNLRPAVLQALPAFPSQLLSHRRPVHEAAVTSIDTGCPLLPQGFANPCRSSFPHIWPTLTHVPRRQPASLVCETLADSPGPAVLLSDPHGDRLASVSALSTLLHGVLVNV